MTLWVLCSLLLQDLPDQADDAVRVHASPEPVLQPPHALLQVARPPEPRSAAVHQLDSCTCRCTQHRHALVFGVMFQVRMGPEASSRAGPSMPMLLPYSEPVLTSVHAQA